MSGEHLVRKEILAALTALEEAVKGIKSGRATPDLLPLFSRLDELTRRLPPNADPNLLHYLAKKSYEKARRLLEGRDPENARGSCG
jgi:hypothetical protein